MNDTVIRENVIYGYAGSTPLYLDIILPVEAVSKPLPVLIYIHGGDKSGIGGREWNARFTQHGFVAVNVNHRLSGEAIFPAQIHDVKAAVRWLRANAAALSIQPDKIGVWGHSSGAHLAALLGVSAGNESLEVGGLLGK